MGCQISVSVAGNNRGKSRAEAQSERKTFTTHLILPTSNGLEFVLGQNFLRESFRSFCLCNYVTDFKVLKLSAGACIAVNCIDFWADVDDFRKINPSSFRDFRVLHIFEKYLMHGAIFKASHIFLISVNSN